GGLWLVLGQMSPQHLGSDAFNVLFYRDRIAAGDRDLLLVVPFEAVARCNHVGCRSELQRLAGDDAHLLIDIPDGLFTDDSLRLSPDRDMPVCVEAMGLGVAPSRLTRAIMGGQRVGKHLGFAPLGYGVAAGDVDLGILLPLDTGRGRDGDRRILGNSTEAQPLSGKRKRARG